MRVGMGYDVHKFDKERPLILGGVNIPHEEGLLGHSDADVLTHAVMDSLLGAMGMGDIGRHFPDTDPAYKNISSLELLSQVEGFLNKKGYQLINLDSVIIAQKPRLASFIAEMEINLANILNTGKDRINVKATTTEGLGFTGRKEGIAAGAIVLLKKRF